MQAYARLRVSSVCPGRILLRTAYACTLSRRHRHTHTHTHTQTNTHTHRWRRLNDTSPRIPGNSQMKTTGGSQSDNWSCCDPSRPIAPAQMQAANSTAGVERAGIGIILALHPDGSLYVHTVCPGGSAEGSLQPGDVLMKIGAEEVFRYAPIVSNRRWSCSSRLQSVPAVAQTLPVLGELLTRRACFAEHQRLMWQNCCWGLRARKSNFGCAGRGGRMVRVLLNPEVKTR